MNTLITGKTVSNILPKALILGLLGAMLVSVNMVNTITSSSQITNIRLANETFVVDPNVDVQTRGIRTAGSNRSANASSPATAMEITSDRPDIYTNLIRRNWTYRIRIAEAAVGSFQAGDLYSVEVYGDNGTDNLPLGIVYFKQNVVENSQIEEVDIEFDLGSQQNIYDSYSVVVTKVQ